MSSGQEVPKTASLSLTVRMVQYYCAYSSVSSDAESSMTWTKHGVLCSYTSYCTVALEKKKKKKNYPVVEKHENRHSVKMSLILCPFGNRHCVVNLCIQLTCLSLYYTVQQAESKMPVFLVFLCVLACIL